MEHLPREVDPVIEDQPVFLGVSRIGTQMGRGKLCSYRRDVLISCHFDCCKGRASVVAHLRQGNSGDSGNKNQKQRIRHNLVHGRLPWCGDDVEIASYQGHAGLPV